MSDRQDREPVLEAIGLSKTYEGPGRPVVALREASLRLEPGESVAVMGASGSGKSTLLHLLAGLDRPTSGSVRVAGEAMSGLDETGRSRLRSRSVGFVFQFHQLLPEFSALENVMMPGWIAGLPERDTRARAVALLNDFDLTPRSDHRPSELSGGEAQRVAVARALLLRPAVLLADEPTGNLDRKAGEALLEILERCRKREGQAIVIATHSEAVARGATRVVGLEEGRLRPITL